MSTLRTALVVMIATATVLATTVAPAHADGARGSSICLPVLATGVGQDLGDGRTTATISSHGLLLGTTNAAFTITGASGAILTFVGPIVFTTHVGTLTAQVTGTLDSATGAFSSQSTSVTGSGLFRGVTGDVKLAGVENLQTGSFTETITGRLCAGSAR